MYRSPIEIIYGQMETQMEGDILRAVQKYGINVDKEELLQALQYDRNQYEKGYADGKADALKWISVKDRLPECYQVVLCYKADRGVRIGKHLAATYADGVSAFKDCCMDYAFGATHWMPLPEPPKGE